MGNYLVGKWRASERQESKVVQLEILDRGTLKIIRIKGEFFLGYVRQVEEVWNQLVQASPEVIAIDCREMTFIDSSAIGTFVKFLHNSMAHNFKLIFFDLNESIARIFGKAKLNKIFTILTREDFESLYMRQPGA
jgi:anti-sigma B factor antagonist